MNREKRTHRIIALAMFLISLVTYLRTIAPTTSFWDCGEFIACSYILAIPHPPGAPLYILIGRIFSMLPLAEDIGLRVNIISSIASALTVMFAYLIIVRLIVMWRGQPQNTWNKVMLYASGILGGLAFAFSDTFWFNAVEAEVYAISMFFTSFVVWLILVWHEKADDPESDKYLLIIAYCIGLATGVHLLMILALPAIFLIIYFRYFKFDVQSFFIFGIVSLLMFSVIYPGIVKWLPNLANKVSTLLVLVIIAAVLIGIYYGIKNRNRLLALPLIAVFLIMVGYSTYTALYIRSNLDPAIDENDPENMKNMVSYLNREQYGEWSITERRAPLWEYQIKKMYIRYFGWQFIGRGNTLGEDRRIVETLSLRGLWGLPFLIGLIGMGHHFLRDWKRAFSVLTLFVMTGVAIVIYLNQDDPQPRERDYVYVASFFAFALWIGIGVTAILEWISKTFRKSAGLRKTSIVVALILLTYVLPIKLLAFNYRNHDRSGNYVAYDYSYNILQSCEKDAILFTNGDNDTFPLWFLQCVYGIRTDVRVVNLSLLNTTWYIKQLKHEEPRVPISLSDAAIDKIGPRYWPKSRTIRIVVPKEAYRRELADLEEQKELVKSLEEPPEIKFDLGPTVFGSHLRVQDLMVLNIIQSNQFRRPIYFALTVSRDNQLNLFRYLRMDGLVFKLVTYPEERVSASRLRENLFNKFQYRGLNDPKVYFNENIKGLLRNYHGAFFSLAQYYGQEKRYDEMLAVLDSMQQIIPKEVIPVNENLSFEIGRMYYIGGRPQEFENRLNYILANGNPNLQRKFQYASIFYQLFKKDSTAERLCQEIIAENPNFGDAYSLLLQIYNKNRQYPKSVTLLENWLKNHPGDKGAETELERLTKLLDTTRSDSLH